MEASLAASLVKPSAFEVIREHLFATVILDTVALVIAALICVVLAVLATLLPRAGAVALDILRPISMAVPAFVLGLWLQVIFGVQLHLFPVFGISSSDTTGFSPVDLLQDHIIHLLLPAATLGFAAVGVILGLAGGGAFTITRKSGSWADLVVCGLGAVLGGTFVVEPVFAWPGIGSVAQGGILLGDRSVLAGAVLVVALFYLVVALPISLGARLAGQRAASFAVLAPSSGAARGARRGARRMTGMVVLGVAGALLLVIVLGALVVPASMDPLQIDLSNRFGPPQPGHWLGFDDLGRDVFSRVLYAARVPLGIGALATALAGVVGTGGGALLGLIPRAQRGPNATVDGVVTTLAGFPALALALLLVAALRPGFFSLVLAFALLLIPLFARRGIALTRWASPLATGQPPAANRSGPNALGSLVAQAPIALALVILIESAVSFLGLGLDLPALDWGSMISDGSTFLTSSLGMVFIPALALGVTVAALAALGEGLRFLLE